MEIYVEDEDVFPILRVDIRSTIQVDIAYSFQDYNSTYEYSRFLILWFSILL